MGCPNLSGLDDSEESCLGRIVIEGFVRLTRQHVVQNGSLFRLHIRASTTQESRNVHQPCTKSERVGQLRTCNTLCYNSFQKSGRGSSVVEQPIRNRQVASSTLALGSI